MFAYEVTDNNGKVFNYIANFHSVEGGVLSLKRSKYTSFLDIKNWISCTVNKLNELGELLYQEEFLNGQANLTHHQAYDRLYG